MVTVTDSRLECVACRERIPLDGVWCAWDSARCLCVRCHDAWAQRRREEIAAEAERIANGADANVGEGTADGAWEDLGG